MAPTFTTEQLLSHLNNCEECGYYVGAPVLCKGQNDPSKKGFWFAKCLNNAQPTPNSCTFFEWRMDIPRGRPTGGKKTPCPGVLCKQGSKPNTANQECTFGVCMKCCRHLQALLTVVRSCFLGEHRKGVVYPTVETNAASVEDPAPRRRGRGRPKKGDQPQDTSGVPPTHADDETPPVPVTPKRGPPKRTSFATPVGPLYLSRQSAIDAEQRHDAERHAERAKQERAHAFVNTLTIQWWAKDGAAPELAEVNIDNPSAFHPKDAPHLVERFRCDTEPFQYYDPKKCAWFTGSKYSAPRDLKKLSADQLFYRSEGVTWGQDMPGQSKKRPAPDDSPANDTPRRPLPPFYDPHARPPFSPFTSSPASTPHRSYSPSSTPHHSYSPSSTPLRSYSPAATEPPMSGSSALSDEADTDPFYNAFDFTPTAVDKSRHLYSAINAMEPRLPAPFPNNSAVSPPIPSTSTSRPFVDPHPVDIDFSTAPRGRGAKSWPWRYVCDMAAGFAAIRRLEDSQPPVERAEAFKQVFGGVFKPTTYREQLRAWRAAGLVAGERERWIQYGRTEEGEWLTFMRSWRQGR